MATKPTLILLAEDSPTDAELARQAFKTDIVTDDLIVVPDGEEALAFVRREGKYCDAARPDLIVLDLNMPKKDGRQVLIELKADARFKQIPVIILTTSADDLDIIKSYESNASCYVTKPMDFDKFRDVARHIKKFFFKVATLPPTF